MSTKYIQEEAEAARKALGEVASAARKRRKEVRDLRRSMQTERDNVIIGARAAMRDVDDEDAVYEEEEQQLLEILEGPTEDDEPVDEESAHQSPPANPPTSDEPPAPPTGTNQRRYSYRELRVMDNQQLQQLLASRLGITRTVTDGNRADVILVLMDGIGRPSSRTTTVVERIQPSSWGTWSWILAFGLGAIGLIVSALTAGFDDFSGIGHGVFTALWVVFVTMTGFFLGGFLGSNWDEE